MRYLVPLIILLATAVVASLIEGTPDPLPAVALGSEVLLHALRASEQQDTLDQLAAQIDTMSGTA